MQKAEGEITVVDVPAGGFYVNDATNSNIIIYSEGAFGCCYLTIEDQVSKKILIAHINAQTVMFEPIADKTVSAMLAEFKKQGGDVATSTVTIVHSGKFEDYEKAQDKKTEKHRLTNGYKEKTENNIVIEPFANEFLERSLVRANVKNIQVIDWLNSNLVDFVANPIVGRNKTDICFVDGKIYLQNYHSNQCPSEEEWLKPEDKRNWNIWKSEVKEHTENSDKAFNYVKTLQDNNPKNTICSGDWETVHNFYLNLKEGLDTGQIKQDGLRFDFSQTATTEFKDKMNNDQFVAINMNNVMQEHLQNQPVGQQFEFLNDENGTQNNIASRITTEFMSGYNELEDGGRQEFKKQNSIKQNGIDNDQNKSFAKDLNDQREQKVEEEFIIK